MSNQKIDFREQVQESNGVISDCMVELGSKDSQFMSLREPWNMGNCMGGGVDSLQPQNVLPVNLSTTIASRFCPQVPGFSAPERYAGLPYDQQINNPTFSSRCSRNYDLGYRSYPCSTEGFSADLAEPYESNLQSRSTVQAAAKSLHYGNQSQFSAPVKTFGGPCSNYSGSDHNQQQKNKLYVDFANSEKFRFLLLLN